MTRCFNSPASFYFSLDLSYRNENTSAAGLIAFLRKGQLEYCTISTGKKVRRMLLLHFKYATACYLP